MGVIRTFTKSLGSASSNGIAHSQSPGAAALTLTSSVVTIDTASATNVAIGRRVILTSGGNDLGITFAITGTNSTGNTITDTVTGTSGGTAQSNLDFVTVSSIVPSGAVATTIIAGTNGVGSSPWMAVNWQIMVMNIGFAVELVSGTANFSVQYTYDDPNNLLAGVAFPLAFSDPIVAAVAVTSDGVYSQHPIAAMRLLINSGTGVLRMRIMQSGIG